MIKNIFTYFKQCEDKSFLSWSNIMSSDKIGGTSANIAMFWTIMSS